MNDRKVIIVGLDSAPAEIVFEHRAELPVLGDLIDKGISGKLRSSDPPITIPAWMVMATGLDPGRLGLYGFRHRDGYSYRDMWIANSRAVRKKKLWDFIGAAGGASCLVSVPPSYPPYPVPGNLISCFITPPGEGKDTTYPAELKSEIEERFGRSTEIRRAQMQSLYWLVDLARRAGIERLIVNGSFVTDVFEPNDVDCVALAGRGFPRDRHAAWEMRRVGLPFIHLQLVRARRFDHLVYVFFATDNRNRAKGVIEVIL